MNSSNRKYTWMTPPFHNCFQSMMDSGWGFCDLGKSRLVIILEKKSFKVFATFSSSVISSSSLIIVIFSEEIVLLERNGLTIFQNDLFSTTLFIFDGEKYSFLAFRRSDTHIFLCFWNKRLFSSLLCFRKRFLFQLRIIIALEISALMNGSWLAHKYRCLCGACLFKTSQQIAENASMPSFSR